MQTKTQELYLGVLFFYTGNNKLRLKRGSNWLFLGLANLQKQVKTFENKSVYFYVRLEFLMCTVPRFILKRCVYKMVDSTFFLLKFKINHTLPFITL